VEVPEGPFDMGAPAGGFAYDNERPRHRAETGRFEIGRYPVTNGEYVEFIASGGYEERALWSDDGWEWKRSSGLAAPLYWSIRGHGLEFSPAEAREASRAGGVGAWDRSTSLGTEPLAPMEPVIHVCQHEAAAFARFSGGRLPTETEWEKAAAWDPGSGTSRPCPWGDREPTPELANLNAAAFGPAPIGSFPGGRSPVGCEQMLGDLWEWTSTPFGGYAGFEVFPYPEYSAVFFGDEHRVLRGSSWATDAGVARSTFRNWDYPIRRQIFAGLRVARSAER
jgi:iron(II)-dependent oxidoreductase